MISDKRYLYEDIYLQIKTHIQHGNYRPGDKLKSVRVFSRELGVSPTTIFNAYYKLEAEGLITARPKQGYFVQEQLPKAAPGNGDGSRAVAKKSLIQEVVEASRQPGLIDFSTGVPGHDLLPGDRIHKSIRKACQAHPEVCTRYPDSRGLPELRRNICKLALSWGRAFHESEVLITAGCMEAMALSLRALTRPGDTVAISDPAYFGTLRLMEVLGLKVLPLPSGGPLGTMTHVLREAMASGRVKAVVLIPNFNNPNGALLSTVDKEAIAGMAARYQVPVIEDDIYGELFYEGNRPVNIKTFDKEGWVIYCNSLSKTLTPGLRIGWVIPGRFYEAIYEQKIVHNLSTSGLSQAALSHFLAKGRYDSHMRRLRREMRIRVARHFKLVEEYMGDVVATHLPPGGLVGWLSLRNGKDGMEIYRKARAAGIGIVPGTVFSPGDRYDTFLRISLGLPLTGERISALAQLGRIIGEY
ncbi:PLP-dependent aminotransferase family protein [Phaeodactylibacter xiamenensis]|uniref:aminotransferase-like domain-containing protein n=1 Tax=Phaeodactylibacter xiamenensis TaxID=1524460 RepID=UPI003CCC2EAF